MSYMVFQRKYLLVFTCANFHNPTQGKKNLKLHFVVLVILIHPSVKYRYVFSEFDTPACKEE